MKVTVDSKKGLKTNLKVFIDKKTIDEKIQLRLNELSKTVNLKGFRPGKVPVDVLKRQFGKAVYGEVLEKFLQESSAQAIKEKGLKVAGQPKLDLKTYGEEKDLSYTLEVDELPSFKIKSTENIKFIDYEINVTDEEVKERIEEIAKNQNNFIEKKEDDSAKEGDLVVFDYNATIEKKDFEGGKGKDIQIVLGKDLFIKGFDKQLINVKKNQKKDVLVTLPENYPKKEFANKKANFECKIINIKKPEKTKIDENFAKSLGAKDLNDLKILMKRQIQSQYKMNLDSSSKNKILEQLEKLHDIELPNNLVEQELKLISQGLSEEDKNKNKIKSEKTAKKRIKLGLILNEIGIQNNIKVEEQEIKSEIEKQIQSMPGQQKQVLEYYQQNPSAAASLRGSLYEEKIINLIKEKSKKSKKIITTKEAEQLLKAESESHALSHKKDKNKEPKNPKKLLNHLKKRKQLEKSNHKLYNFKILIRYE